MRRWTNGLPGATARLGAKMALRESSASQCRMRADTHPGPEQQCSTQRSDTLMQLSRSTAHRSPLRRTAGPYILAQSVTAPVHHCHAWNWGNSGHGSEAARAGSGGLPLTLSGRLEHHLSGSPALRRPSKKCSASSGSLKVLSRACVPSIVHLGSIRRTSAASARASSSFPNWA